MLTSGTEALGADLTGEPVLGLRGRTIGCQAATSKGQWWLRVVTEPAGWACGPAWTGNVDAGSITAVRHPEVHHTAEWDDHHRRARAYFSENAPRRG